MPLDFFSGDKLCDNKKIRSWRDRENREFPTNLACFPGGWSDGAKIVKPEIVFCG